MGVLRSYHTALALCLLILLVGGSVHVFLGNSGPREQVIGNEDAYISYRYAQNFFRGHGLVFNPGERVEGYSTLSYVLLMSTAFLFTHDDGVYVFSSILNLVCAAAALLVFARFLRNKLGPGVASVGALLFALCLPLWAAIGSGMETCLVLFLYITIWMTTESLVETEDRRHMVLLCIFSVLALLSRADGFLVPGAAIAYLILKRKTRAAIACASTLGGAAALYVAWRYHYYGYPFPNTYYLRVTGPVLWRARFALRQLSQFAFYGGLLPYLVVFLFAGLHLVRRWVRAGSVDLKWFRFDHLLALGWITYWFFIGGDHLSDRFLLILFPLGIYCLLEYVRAEGRSRAAALLVVLVLVVQFNAERMSDPRLHFTKHRYDGFITAGKFLREHHPGKSVASNTIGKIPFFLDSYTVDMLGVVDPVIAHSAPTEHKFAPSHVKFNPDYTLAKKADFIADWIDPTSLDLSYGLDRNKLGTAGYRLEYLLYTGSERPNEPIVEVSGIADDEIRGLINHGYNYAMMARIATGSDSANVNSSSR